MTGSYAYPDEHGIEVGERCGRGGCRGRMIAVTALCDNCAYGEDADRCFCAANGYTECFECGADPRFE